MATESWVAVVKRNLQYLVLALVVTALIGTAAAYRRTYYGREACLAKLRSLQASLEAYAASNGGHYPRTLQSLGGTEAKLDYDVTYEKVDPRSSPGQRIMLSIDTYTVTCVQHHYILRPGGVSDASTSLDWVKK